MPKNLNLSHTQLRRDYDSKELLEAKLKAHPLKQFGGWFLEAVKKKVPDANAFILATADLQARPCARVLLMKGYDDQGITFFTNYSSEKGIQLAQNPYGEAVFFWNQLNRQVRIRGAIRRLDRKASLAYFHSRPQDAQIAALISQQSRMIESRKVLEEKFRECRKQYQSSQVEMPKDWGGYILQAAKIEFWQGRPNRLHDRIVYIKNLRGRWKKIRLQP